MHDNKKIWGLLDHVRAKQLLSLGGLLFIGFILTHYYGLAFIFTSDEALNTHTRHLDENPMLPFMELGLAFIFLTHMIIAIGVVKSSFGKPVKAWTKRQTLAFSTRITGPIVAMYVIVHLYQYRFQKPGDLDFARMMREHFSHLGPVLFYSVCSAVIGLHCWQGLWAATVSWGLARTKAMQDKMDLLAMVFGIFIFAFPTFLAFWIYFGGGQS